MICYKNDKTLLADKNNIKHQKNQPHLCKKGDLLCCILKRKYR